MHQKELITLITQAVSRDVDMQALFLSGSFGRSQADEFSDIDLLALVEVERSTSFATSFRQKLEQITPIVFWNERRIGGHLLNAITADWLRCDLYIAPPETGLKGRTRSQLVPLIDPGDIFGKIPDTTEPYRPDIQRIEFLIKEFLRVIGLLDVVLGRGELLTATSGVMLQRDGLVALLLEEIPQAERGGALHLSRILSPEQMAMLNSLTLPALSRAELIAAHTALACAFLPEARRIAGQYGVEWPHAFEAATFRHIKRSLGIDLQGI